MPAAATALLPLVIAVAIGLGRVTDAEAGGYVFAGSYYSTGGLATDLAVTPEPPPYGPGLPSVLPPTIYPTQRPAYANLDPGFSVVGRGRFARVTLGRGQNRDITFLGNAAIELEDF